MPEESTNSTPVYPLRLEGVGCEQIVQLQAVVHNSCHQSSRFSDVACGDCGKVLRYFWVTGVNWCFESRAVCVWCTKRGTMLLTDKWGLDRGQRLGRAPKGLAKRLRQSIPVFLFAFTERSS